MFDTVLIPSVLSDGKVEQAQSALRQHPPLLLLVVPWSVSVRVYSCHQGKMRKSTEILESAKDSNPFQLTA